MLEISGDVFYSKFSKIYQNFYYSRYSYLKALQFPLYKIHWIIVKFFCRVLRILENFEVISARKSKFLLFILNSSELFDIYLLL